MLKNFLKFFTFALASVLLFSGCGTKIENKNVKKVVLVTHLGPSKDKSFNEGILKGIDQFISEVSGRWEKSNAIETKAPEELTSNIESSVKTNDVIIVSGGMLAYNEISSVAKKYLDKKFILIDAIIPQDGPENLYGANFSEQEAGFLGGAVAAMKSVNKKIAFMGGEQIEPVEKYGYGYIAGAKYVNPDINILSEYAQTFKDVSVGKQKADSSFNSGADVIFAAAGCVGNGVMDATKENRNKGKDVWMIGVDSDQYELGMLPGKSQSIMLTSAIKKVDVASCAILKDIDAEKIQPRETKYYNIKNDGVGLPENNPNFTEEIKNKTNEIVKKLKNDEIKVPSNKNELDLKNVTGQI